MDIENLQHFIKKSLQYYDDQKLKYIDFINNDDIIVNTSMEDITIKIKNKIYNGTYEILGYFDNNTKIWIWGWGLINLDLDKTKICRDLLNYGLKLEPLNNLYEHHFIKSLLVNSRILIEDSIQLDINLSIYAYLTRDKYIFIYPHKIYTNKDKNDYIMVYYLIKTMNI